MLIVMTKFLSGKPEKTEWVISICPKFHRRVLWLQPSFARKREKEKEEREPFLWMIWCGIQWSGLAVSARVWLTCQSLHAFKTSIFSASGRRHVNSLYTSEEQEKSGTCMYLFDTFARTCLWRHWYRRHWHNMDALWVVFRDFKNIFIFYFLTNRTRNQ